jgi:hypothetical protein
VNTSSTGSVPFSTTTCAAASSIIAPVSRAEAGDQSVTAALTLTS